MAEFSLTDLRCEYHTDPLGIDVSSPRLSWKLRAGEEDGGLSRRGLRQSAYQILAASAPERLTPEEADLWDSGQVASDQSVLIPYGGPPLASGQRAWWTVRVWDENGNASALAPAAFWEMGLLHPEDWAGAEWIGSEMVGGPYTSVPCPQIRRVFTLPEAFGTARLTITALGLYDVTINGTRVGGDTLTPGWTDFDRRVAYQTYDVTDQLKPGENVLAAVLGDGWYCGFVGGGPRQLWGDRPKLMATLKAGETILVTDATWKVGIGPTLAADLIQGETYDARRETPGWDSDPAFDDSGWQAARVFPDPGIARVSGQRGVTVRPQQELSPINDPSEMPRWPAPNYVFDMGQNLVGRVRLKVKGDAGTTIRLRFAEVLKGGPAAKSGEIYTENLRAAKQTDLYTLKGDPNGEVWEPRFTFHGFRYVEYTVYPPTHPTAQAEWKPERPERDTVTAIVLHSDTPKTGDFECSDPLLNQLQQNIDWGQRGNFLEVPTDCPQRDERLGWTGDAQVFIRTAAFNRDVAAFFTKWTQDLRDAQSKTAGGYPPIVPVTDRSQDGGPAWADAGIICPWTIYQCYGDTRLLAEHYDSMRRFMDYLQREVTKDGIRSYDGMPTFQGFGDWLALDGSGRTEGGTPKDLIGTAFTAYDAHLMANIARLLGRDEDAAGYDRLFESVRSAFQRRYLTPAGLIVGGTQTAYVLALHFDLLPESARAAAAEELVSDIRKRGWKLSTGFVGSPYLPHVLSDTGHWDVAFRLLHQTQWPSWLYAVTQGATTIWERWDGWTHDKGFQDPGMNSFNHYAYGAIGAWLYERVAGLGYDAEQPGGKRLLLRPHPAGSGLTRARAVLETPYGRAESAWQTAEDGGITWSATVPPNTEAAAFIPTTAGAAAITEGGRPAAEASGIQHVEDTAEATVYTLAPGTYRFEVAPPV